ncbi:transport protein [Halobacterium hubeiense]|uniref:Transport protein n=1 Tax=Halobacterium hubeiense TaxID=1407499 RepID=A0A0U5AEL2_9EURY|nr:SLC13 family permease [Halobacterium hubeiense]CQH56778.1 transport protein [Halobacterium hubeiense]
MTTETTWTDVLRGQFDPAWLSLPVGIAAAAAVLVYAPVEADMASILAITVFSISLWVGAPVAPWLTGLLAVGLVGAAFSTDLALTGFQSAATWLVVLGILLGEATRQSGLASAVERAALGVLPGDAATNAKTTYRNLLVVLCVAALGFVVLVPSSLVRVLILGPILISVGKRFSDRSARVGLFLGPLFVTYYAGTGILTGSLANIIINGLLEANAGVSIGWMEWAVWLGPVMGVGRAAVITAIAYALYRPADADAIDVSDNSEHGTEAASEARRMMAFLLVGVAIWATDSVHGLHPLYGALVVTVLAFTPRVGVVGADAVENANFSIVFFLGAIFAIAAGLQQTGFTDVAADAILASFPQDASLSVALAFLALASLALTFLMEGLAVASVLTPVLVAFAESAGLPLYPVMMTEAVALNSYFFPYQSAVLVAILGLDVVDSMELIKMAALCSLATLFVLLPVQIGIFALAF